VTILRTSQYRGISESRNIGLNHLKDKVWSVSFSRSQHVQEVKTAVFLEVGAIVSDDWLWPLLDSLQKHPKSGLEEYYQHCLIDSPTDCPLVVYPSVDLLDDHTGKIFPSENVIATLDWSLKLSWEIISPTSASRMPLLPSSPISRAESLLSPALPPTYAANVQYLLGLHSPILLMTIPLL
jgi:hypothetical protein